MISLEFLIILLVFPLCLAVDRALVKQGMAAGKRLAIEGVLAVGFLAALLAAKASGLL